VPSNEPTPYAMADWPYNGPWQTIRLTILDRDAHTCQVHLPGCTQKADAVDHIIPTSHGGPPYDPDNLRSICTRCNTRLSNRPPNPPSPPTSGTAPPTRNW
jgi:5-methylcytosine-specific restriction endonuclease McrA